MPWPVRSTRLGLYLGTPAANTPVTLGTVPAGKVWLFKDWSAYNAGAGTRNVIIFLRSGGVDHVIDAAAALASGSVIGNHQRNVVLAAGDSLRFQTSLATPIHISAHGAQLG